MDLNIIDNIRRFTDIDFGELRFVIMKNTPYFVAIDVCRILDIKNPWDAMSRLDNDEKIIFHSKNSNVGNADFRKIDENSNLGITEVRDIPNRGLNLVNESGLYHLIFMSRKPLAKKFRKWVTSVVLPAIRKSGMYIDTTHEEVRKLGIHIRKNECKCIGSLFNYGIKQGYKINLKKLISSLTIITQCVGCNIPITGRDKATVNDLENLIKIESDLMVIVIKGINDGKDFNDIYKQCLDLVNEYQNKDICDENIEFIYNPKTDFYFGYVVYKKKNVIVKMLSGEDYKIPYNKAS